MRRQNRQKSAAIRNRDGNDIRNFCRFSRRQKVGKSGRRSPSAGQAQPFGSSAGLVQVRASGKRCAALSVEKTCTRGPGGPFGGFEGCSLTKHRASPGSIRFGRGGPHRGPHFYLAVPRTLPVFFYAPLRVSLRRLGPGYSLAKPPSLIRETINPSWGPRRGATSSNYWQWSVYEQRELAA